MPLRAGDLDRMITIEQYALTRDADNQPIETWTAIATVAASWRRATANERLASAQVTAMVTDIFEIRWAPTVVEADPKCRLVYDGRSYDLTEVTEIGRQEGLLIKASARADMSVP